MLKFARTSAFAAGMLTAAAATAHAQSIGGYPGTAYQTPPAYAYSYPAYNPGAYYNSGLPASGWYMGRPYATPKAFWDPYVGSRPYSDNAGPKASGHGD
jgi:hypothetical protein